MKPIFKVLFSITVSLCFALFSNSQSVCQEDTTLKYKDYKPGISKNYFPNGNISVIFIDKHKSVKIKTWDSCGKLLNKKKSYRTRKNTPYSKGKILTYHPNQKFKSNRGRRIKITIITQ